MRAKPSSRLLAGMTEGFLLQKRVNGCSPKTLRVYKTWLDRLAAAAPDTAALDAIAATRFFADIRDGSVSASTIHQAYRTVKTFVRWLLATGALSRNPMDGLSIRTPQTLPTVPTEAELVAVLRACPASPEGARNHALILAMADAGLRCGEAQHLLVED